MDGCNVVLLNGKDVVCRLTNSKPVNHATQSGNSVTSKKDTRANFAQLVKTFVKIQILQFTVSVFAL
jgi:hypothetical protein